MKNGYKQCKDVGFCNGTSFHNVEINASLEKLERLFGKATYLNGDKSTHEWVLVGPKGECITIYDYKYNGVVEEYWHIGGKNEANELRFADWFNAQV